MDSMPKNAILELHTDTLHEVRKIHNLDNLEYIKDTVNKLEEWITSEKKFKESSYLRHYLETSLISSKGSMERAQQRMNNVRRLRSQQPQYFGNFNIKEDFKEFDGIMTQVILPKQTKDYNRILFLRNAGNKFEVNLILQITRIYIMIFEYLKIHDYFDGIITVVDLSEVSVLELLKRINLNEVKQSASILIEGYGVRLKGLHIISKSRIINLLIWILKQVLSAKLITRIHVHQSIQTVYNFIPKETLPIEYGGEEKSYKELHDEWRNQLSTDEFRSYLEDMSNFFTD